MRNVLLRSFVDCQVPPRDVTIEGDDRVSGAVRAFYELCTRHGVRGQHTRFRWTRLHTKLHTPGNTACFTGNGQTFLYDLLFLVRGHLLSR